MPLDIPRIRALCFDVDGTLSDTDDLMVTRVARLLSPLHPVFPRRDLRPLARWAVLGMETPGNLLYHALDRIHLDGFLAWAYNTLARSHLYYSPSHFWIIPQVIETIQRLSTRYPMSIVSARDRRGTCAFLEQFGLTPHFKAIATSQTCRHTKPFPDPVLWAARQMGVKPEECLMIGDTTVDIHAGRQAGAQTVGVLCGFGTEKELRRAGADLILDTTSSLLQHLIPLEES